MKTKKLNFTANEAKNIAFKRPQNVVIEGTFDGASVTHTMQDTATPLRAADTVATSYRSSMMKNTFTITNAGASTDITISFDEIYND